MHVLLKDAANGPHVSGVKCCRERKWGNVQCTFKHWTRNINLFFYWECVCVHIKDTDCQYVSACKHLSVWERWSEGVSQKEAVGAECLVTEAANPRSTTPIRNTPSAKAHITNTRAECFFSYFHMSLEHKDIFNLCVKCIKPPTEQQYGRCSMTWQHDRQHIGLRLHHRDNLSGNMWKTKTYKETNRWMNMCGQCVWMHVHVNNDASTNFMHV